MTSFLKPSLKLELLFLLTISCTFLIFPCCNSKKQKKEEDSFLVKKQYTSKKNEVTISILKKEIFKEEVVSNGKLKATQKSVLKFKTNGVLKT